MDDLDRGVDVDLCHDEAEEHLGEDDGEDGVRGFAVFVDFTEGEPHACAEEEDEPREAAVDEVEDGLFELVRPAGAAGSVVEFGEGVGHFADLRAHDAFGDGAEEEAGEPDAEFFAFFTREVERPGGVAAAP